MDAALRCRGCSVPVVLGSSSWVSSSIAKGCATRDSGLRMRRTLVLSLLLLAGCGSPEAQSPTPPPVTPEPTPVEPTPVATGAAQATPEAPPPTAPTPETPPVVAEVPPTPPTADGPEVDLLHAVVTRVAVSSAYRDDSAQVSRLVDGDVETAWNSRSGDLVGAFIEVDVPPEASVRAIAMTTGFTHTTARADLFTGNHRVSRVRLSRDGAALGEHTLDTSGRGLVEIPVSQPGGRFRIEVLETLPGERSDWRELCVSELRVLGTAPGARPASASPATSVGALTGSIEEAEAAEEAAEEAEDAAAIAALELEAYEEDLEDWPVYVIGLSPAAEGEEFVDVVSASGVGGVVLAASVRTVVELVVPGACGAAAAMATECVVRAGRRPSRGEVANFGRKVKNTTVRNTAEPRKRPRYTSGRAPKAVRIAPPAKEPTTEANECPKLKVVSTLVRSSFGNISKKRRNHASS